MASISSSVSGSTSSESEPTPSEAHEEAPSVASDSSASVAASVGQPLVLSEVSDISEADSFPSLPADSAPAPLRA